jgi:predicted nucleic acid-binding protein
MLQAPAQPRAPVLVYIDANLLFYWILPDSHDPSPGSRQSHRQYHQEAQQLALVFGRYMRPANQIQVVTSQWALIEVHSVLYKDFLWANNIVRANIREDPRRHFPPHSRSLHDATQFLQTQMDQLRNSVVLQVNQPDIGVWETSLRIGEECGIYAPDCLHLATALHLGCDLLVTQDIGFLNSIHHFQNEPAVQILQDLFHLVNPPTIVACPLLPSRRLQHTTLTAREHLGELGYI